MNNLNQNNYPKKRFKWIVLIFILVVITAGLKFYVDFLLSPADSQRGDTQTFIVENGESTIGVAKRLESEGFIRSANAFAMLAKSKNSQGQIQAGEFNLSPSLSSEEILKKLQVGVSDKRITLVEGWRIEEMAQEFNSKLGIEQSEFVAVALEGYMFPDTYYFGPKASASEVAEEMKKNFNRKYDADIQARIKKLGLTSEQGVVLASIVEREGRSDEVRQMVAGILLKRFKMGMALNADATVQYALITQGSKKPPAEGWWKRHLTRDDLKIDSVYNTYLHSGLPPTPIANPGLSSLQAVAEANPNTPYIYYYHDSEGRSHYARTLEEHNENVARYR